MRNEATRRLDRYILAQQHLRAKHDRPMLDLANWIANKRAQGVVWRTLACEFDDMESTPPSMETLRQWYLADQENEK